MEKYFKSLLNSQVQQFQKERTFERAAMDLCESLRT
jgi:hypothetical protein